MSLRYGRKKGYIGSQGEFGWILFDEGGSDAIVEKYQEEMVDATEQPTLVEAVPLMAREEEVDKRQVLKLSLRRSKTMWQRIRERRNLSWIRIM